MKKNRAAAAPRIAVVHTQRSPCRCHEFLLRAVRALGLRGIEILTEDLLLRREALRAADLVLEHADTLLGRGELRPLVRHQIEAWGGKLAGAPAAAAHASDDKLEAQRRLLAAGLTVPRSRLLERPAGDIGLGFPLILKRPFEHGSRGVACVKKKSELLALSRRWLRAGGGALLAEEFIEGRELAAAVLEVNGRPRCLPLIEVLLRDGQTYSAGRKWGPGPLPIEEAALDPGQGRAIAGAAVQAFRALGLRDYARFDLRLTPAGELYFLEANARPSVEDGTELRLAARLAGLGDAQLVALILESAARRHRLQRLHSRLAPFLSPWPGGRSARRRT